MKVRTPLVRYLLPDCPLGEAKNANLACFHNIMTIDDYAKDGGPGAV